MNQKSNKGLEILNRWLRVFYFDSKEFLFYIKLQKNTKKLLKYNDLRLLPTFWLGNNCNKVSIFTAEQISPII
jgi:hypothetical protein